MVHDMQPGILCIQLLRPKPNFVTAILTLDPDPPFGLTFRVTRIKTRFEPRGSSKEDMVGPSGVPRDQPTCSGLSK